RRVDLNRHFGADLDIERLSTGRYQPGQLRRFDDRRRAAAEIDRVHREARVITLCQPPAPGENFVVDRVNVTRRQVFKVVRGVERAIGTLARAERNMDVDACPPIHPWIITRGKSDASPRRLIHHPAWPTRKAPACRWPPEASRRISAR